MLFARGLIVMVKIVISTYINTVYFRYGFLIIIV